MSHLVGPLSIDLVVEITTDMWQMENPDFSVGWLIDHDVLSHPMATDAYPILRS